MKSRKSQHTSWDGKIGQHLSERNALIQNWRQQFAHNKTPDGFLFFPVNTKNQSSTTSQIGCFTALVVAISTFVFNSLNANGLKYRYQAVSFFASVTICIVLPILIEKWNRSVAKYHNKEKNSETGWGMFIGKNNLIYRDINEEIFIMRAQINSIRPSTRRKTEETPRLVIAYQKAGHLNINHLYVGDDYGSNRKGVIKALLAWDRAEEQQCNEQQKWLLKLHAIHRYRHWLPTKIIQHIPDIPCSIEEQKQFLLAIKPYQFRLRFADFSNALLLSVFAAVNLTVILAALYALSKDRHGVFVNIYDVALWMFLPLPFYANCLLTWYRKKHPALLLNCLFTSYFFIVFAVSGAKQTLEADSIPLPSDSAVQSTLRGKIEEK